MNPFGLKQEVRCPISNIRQVWDFLSARLREIRERLSNINDDLYKSHDRLSDIGTIHEAISNVQQYNKTISVVSSITILEQILEYASGATNSPRKLEPAKEVIKDYITKLNCALENVTKTKQLLSDDLLKYMELYCKNYIKLGVADDKFYRTLKSKSGQIRDHLNKFDKMIKFFKQDNKIEIDLFCDHHFSLELSMTYDCELCPILRILPDVCQKLEICCDMASDWLRSDKVYMEQVEKEIEKSRIQVKDMSSQLSLCKLEYDRIFSLLKQKQNEFERYEENTDTLWRDLSRLESKKARLEIEIAAVGKTLTDCRDQLRDLSSVEYYGSEYDELDLDLNLDEHERAVRSLDRGTLSGSLGKAHSSYRSRLCHNARAHSNKLDMIRKKKKKLEKQIAKKKALLKDIEGNEQEVQKLSKKLRVISRQKAKVSEEVNDATSHMNELMDVMKNRLNPEGKKKKKRSIEMDYLKVPKHAHKSKRKPKKSADLHKAFHIVKNNIGYGWKDLARALPYKPAIEIGELNNEIKAIEYEHQGQLKEQAYQSLFKWYSHNGRLASIEHLLRTLRTLNENRLADNIDRYVLQVLSSASDVSRPSSYSTSS